MAQTCRSSVPQYITSMMLAELGRRASHWASNGRCRVAVSQESDCGDYLPIRCQVAEQRSGSKSA